MEGILISGCPLTELEAQHIGLISMTEEAVL